MKDKTWGDDAYTGTHHTDLGVELKRLLEATEDTWLGGEWVALQNCLHGQQPYWTVYAQPDHVEGGACIDSSRRHDDCTLQDLVTSNEASMKLITFLKNNAHGILKMMDDCQRIKKILAET